MRKKKVLPGLLAFVGFIVAMGGAETWSQGEYGQAIFPLCICLCLMLAALAMQKAQKRSARKAATLQGARENNYHYIVAGNGTKVK